MRPTTIGRFGIASLGATLLATVGALCCFGQVGLILGFVAMIGGFACFYLSREEGSKRDLIVGIIGMITGFLIIAYAIYGMRLDEQQQGTGLGMGVTDQIIKMGGPPKIFGGDEDEPRPQTTPNDPFVAPERSLPEPTRPATRNKTDKDE